MKKYEVVFAKAAEMQAELDRHSEQGFILKEARACKNIQGEECLALFFEKEK